MCSLHKCVVCVSVLQRDFNDGGDGCLSILFRYECRVGHLFIGLKYDGLLLGVLFRHDVHGVIFCFNMRKTCMLIVNEMI